MVLTGEAMEVTEDNYAELYSLRLKQRQRPD